MSNSDILTMVGILVAIIFGSGGAYIALRTARDQKTTTIELAAEQKARELHEALQRHRPTFLALARHIVDSTPVLSPQMIEKWSRKGDFLDGLAAFLKKTILEKNLYAPDEPIWNATPFTALNEFALKFKDLILTPYGVTSVSDCQRNKIENHGAIIVYQAAYLLLTHAGDKPERKASARVAFPNLEGHQPKADTRTSSQA
jgi:hypothetical protein